MATRKDIAEKAQVSVSVVSRALNNSGYVNAKKREQILQIAEELGYHPNPVAMSLMTQQSRSCFIVKICGMHLILRFTVECWRLPDSRIIW